MKRISSIVLVAAVVALCVGGCARVEAPAKKGPVGPVVALDASTFDAKTASGVVLVDFFATWCGPCKIQGPIVEEVSGSVQGAAVVAKLDVDSAPDVAQKLGIQSIPTLILFKDGKLVQQFVGLTQAEELIKAVKAAAGK